MSHRRGFLLGDGAGVGKGRTIAGIIKENIARNRLCHVWVSVSNDLIDAARRDLEDLDVHVPIVALKEFPTGVKVAQIRRKFKEQCKRTEQCEHKEAGVLFTTYALLARGGWGKGSRGQLLSEWANKLENDCVMVFDECHMAKGLVAKSDEDGDGGDGEDADTSYDVITGAAVDDDDDDSDDDAGRVSAWKKKKDEGSKTGRVVLELQKAVPKARVVYASATGVSEPKNMAYMIRLGLWGPGTGYDTFSKFCSALQKRDLGGSEMMACYLKQRGDFVSKTCASPRHC